MLLTHEVCYGLVAVKCLAETSRKSVSLSARELAGLFGISEKALAKTLQHLVKAGLLKSRPGVNGGYSLAHDPESLTVLDVVSAISSRSRLGRVPASSSRDPLRLVSQAVEAALDQLTIARM
jgi:Rrf2 family protein